MLTTDSIRYLKIIKQEKNLVKYWGLKTNKSFSC
jgi:hypothetical protein